MLQSPAIRIRIKGTLARDFLLFFHISSNLLRYSKHLKLCIDSFNAELIFCFKLGRKVKNVLVDINVPDRVVRSQLAPFNSPIKMWTEREYVLLYMYSCCAARAILTVMCI